jgi:hypothetical protein
MKVAILLLVTVLVAGCTLTPCDPPKKTINGECCLDTNGNGVCDSRENINTDCQLPNMPYQGGCCLDINGNHICDNLETEVIETTTTNPQEVIEETTTTLAEANTTSDNQSTTPTTSTTIRKPTTTTMTTLPQMKPGVCYDSDGGENPDTKGVTIGEEWAPPHKNVTRADSCRNNQTVTEYYCEKRFIHKEPLLCQSWLVCEEGRCCLPQGSQCKSSQECCGRECVKQPYFSICS